MTEQEAINRIVSGDSQSFGVLYDLYVDRVYKFVYFRTHHKQTAEDLTSIVFAKAFDKFASFDKKAKFSTWIFRIARNSIIDHWRTRKETVEINDAFDFSSTINTARDYEMREKLASAQKYLNSLPAEQRELIIMRLWDGLSYAEIAQIAGKSEANLRVNFSRILARMQKEMVLTLIILIALSLKTI